MKTKSICTLRATVLAVLGLALSGHAAELIPATSMTAAARHNYTGGREPGKVLNGLTNGGGFTDDGTVFLAGASDPNNPADYRVDSTAGGTSTFGQNTNWVGNNGANSWIRVDLGADYNLDSMAFFNMVVSSGAETDRGVQQADIYYRTAAQGDGSNTNFDQVAFDNIGWTLLGTAGTQTFTQNTGGDTAVVPDVVSLAGITARYVAFDINQTHGDGNVGISELLFFQDTGADPALEIAGGSPDPDFAFGNAFEPTSPTRTVQFVNNSPGGNTITIDSVIVTDDGGGVFGTPTVTYSGTNVLANGDTVSIEVPVNTAISGAANGILSIDTTSSGGGVDPDFNDKGVGLSATVIASGTKLNPNPFMESGLADWDNLPALGAVPVSPGLAGGSSGMARVRGIGDASSTGPADLTHPSSFMQSTGVVNGAPNWQLSAFFTPIDAANFAAYADGDMTLGITQADGAFSDRTFQLVVLSADTGRPFPTFDNPQAAGTLINIAYMPDGVQDNVGVADFYVFDGDIGGTTTGTWIPTGIGAIQGSIDNDGDISSTNGVGDGLLDPTIDPSDVVNAYRILVTGTDFDTTTASYDITVTKFSGTDTFVSGTATGLTAFQGVSGTNGTPAGYSFITSDISNDPQTGSNQGDVGGDPGLTPPFWVDDVCFFNVAGPDPALTVASTPDPIVVVSPATTGTSSFTIRNDGTSTNLDIDSIGFTGGTGFSVTSPSIPFSIAPGAIQEITIQWDSATAADSFEVAIVTVSDSVNSLFADVNVKAGLAFGSSVVLDYNDMLPGNMAQAGNADTGIGFTEPLWNSGTGTQVVVAGDLDLTTVPGYSIPATGTPQSQSTNNATARQQERQIDLGGGINPVWFSFLAQKPTSGGRVGINLNNNTIGAIDPRVIWIGNLVAFRTGNANVATTPLTSTAATQLFVGRITINDGDAGEDRVEIWVNPADMSSIAALGAPDINYAAVNSLGNGLTRLNPSVYGATGLDAPVMDNVRLSDLAESAAFNVIRTGVAPVPDPLLEVDAGGDPDFAFGNIFFTGSGTRSVTFGNNSATGGETITINSIAVTDDPDGIFGSPTVTYGVGNTGTPPVLEDGDTVTIDLTATFGDTGTFGGELTVDTTSSGLFDPDNNDKVLPLSAGFYLDGQKLNGNPFMDANLGGYAGGAVFAAKGIAPGSIGMARLRGQGDPSGISGTTLFQATGIPDGAPDFQFSAYFTPADGSTFGDYAGTTGPSPDGAFTDRTFQWVLLGADSPAPDDGDPDIGLDSTVMANAIINIAYMPDGITTGGTPDFYVFNGSSWVATGIGAIQGSIDNDPDMDSTNGVGDGLLDPTIDPADVVNVYRLFVRGTGFGTGGVATYDVTVNKVSGTDTFTTGSALGLSAFQGLDGSTNAPAAYAFGTSDTSPSNVGGGFTTPFWVDDICFHAGTAPDPSLVIIGASDVIGVFSPDIAGTSTYTVRNDGFAANLDISSVTLTGSGFTLLSPTLPVGIAPSSGELAVIEFDSSVVAPETAAITVVTVNSNDPNDPALELNLNGALTSFSKLVANWDFEIGGHDTTLNTDTFAVWNEVNTDAKVFAVPGLIAGTTTTGAYLDTTGGTVAMNQEFGVLVNEFVAEFLFAYEDAPARDFNAIVRGQFGQVNLRYEGNVWSAFNNVTGTTWEPVIDMSAGPLLASVDADNNGSLDDPGDTKNVYKLRITGTGWGFGAPTYQVEVLDLGGGVLGDSGPGIAKYQNAAPTVGGAQQIEFTNQFGGIVGSWVDEVCISGAVIIVPEDIVITDFSIDLDTGIGSVTFTSSDGLFYELRASNDVNNLDPFSANLVTDGTAAGATTTFNFTDAGAVGQSVRVYRIERP